MILRRDSNNKNENENTKKYNFRRKYARSIRWFDLDHEWLEENFQTRESNLYRNFIKQVLGVMRKKSIICSNNR